MKKTIVSVPVSQNVEMAFKAILTLSENIQKVEIEKISATGIQQVLETGKNLAVDILAQIARRVRNIRLESRIDGDYVVICYC